jgi:hypothetical protein
MQRFVQNASCSTQEPFSITADHSRIELTELVTRLAIGGLLHALRRLDVACAKTCC